MKETRKQKQINMTIPTNSLKNQIFPDVLICSQFPGSLWHSNWIKKVGLVVGRRSITFILIRYTVFDDQLEVDTGFFVQKNRDFKKRKQINHNKMQILLEITELKSLKIEKSKFVLWLLTKRVSDVWLWNRNRDLDSGLDMFDTRIIVIETRDVNSRKSATAKTFFLRHLNVHERKNQGKRGVQVHGLWHFSRQAPVHVHQVWYIYLTNPFMYSRRKSKLIPISILTESLR